MRVILYGNSVFLAGIKAELESRGEFDVITIAADGSAADSLICARGADVVIFDLAAAQPNFAVTLLRDSPGSLLIGVDPSSDQLLVLSGQQERAVTTTDLVRMIGARRDSTSPHAMAVRDAAGHYLDRAGTFQLHLPPSLHSEMTWSRRTVLARMLRVLTFDRSVYGEVECDPAGTRQAARVVAFVAGCAALGTVLLGYWYPGAILGAMLAALVRWLLWSGLDYLMVRLLFRRPMSLERLLRALGYAQTPQLLAVLAFVPVAGDWVVVASRLLTVIAGNLAIGHAFELRTYQAVAIRLVGFAVASATAAAVEAVLGDVPFLTAILRP